MMNPAHGNFNCNPVEDPKVRFRHHSLLQDYQELHMDTEAMRKRLETMQERKATLMAEVRFLRRRYRHLRQDQPVKKGEEEEEMNNSEERMRVEQSSACKRMSSIEMLSCRNGGDGSHKRKSSWQDPVAALRV
ncbi:hypothetical protein F2Q68_00007928 [Brassica cretica]|uniref:Uncharacterized protein n=1 Tax=Brassica cretica TaxID=69181 RepID=A0A8S9KWL0_BRACR|nr:hypothetical protein F2Q68_00007928 [Brassica cretica]